MQAAWNELHDVRAVLQQLQARTEGAAARVAEIEGELANLQQQQP